MYKLGFERDLRFKLFGDTWLDLPDSFELAMQYMAKPEAPAPRYTLEQILKRPTFLNRPSTDMGEDAGQYGSVINFPNFLLQVLRIITVTESDTDTPLDDKRLLIAFDDHHSGKDCEADAKFARKFVINLLKCRMLFDRFIIKRKNDLDWSLEQLIPNHASYHYVSSADKLNQQLIMQLSMFHVSFPTQVYKHWLSAVLYYLLQRHESNDFSAQKYTEFLDRLSDKFFYGRFGENEPVDYFSLCFKNSMPEPTFDYSHLKQGTHIQNFIFNRLDYRLWRKLKDGQRFDIDMEFVKPYVDKFSFTFRTSVEHYFPQHPIAGKPMDDKTLHCFGNLCLISHNDNSKYSNNEPATKKKQANDKLMRDGVTESLKQVFMMSYPNWGPEYTQTIAAHQKMMIDVLCE